MNSIVITLCTLVLGICAGAGWQHWAGQPCELSNPAPQAIYLPSYLPHTNAGNDDGHQPVALAAHTTAHQKEILEALRQLQDNQNAVNSQVTAITRDLNNVQFQVETLSGDFRPLRMKQDNPVFPNGINPLLPPNQ